MAAKEEAPVGLTAPKEFFNQEGQQESVAWGLGSHLSGLEAFPARLMKALQLAAITMNDTATTVSAGPDFVLTQNSHVFFRPDFHSHLIFLTHWIISVTAGSPAPTTEVSLDIQTWINQYHVLISPSGFANDWTITVPPIPASTTHTFNETFVGGIFNVELRKAPDSHMIEFHHRLTTLPTGWTGMTIKPRITLVSAIASNQVDFVRV